MSLRLRRIKANRLKLAFKSQKEMTDFKIELSQRLNCKVGDIYFTFDEIK